MCLPYDGVFFSIAHRPRKELAHALGCALTSEGYVQVDEGYQTTVPHVYAAGDITAREEVCRGCHRGEIHCGQQYPSLPVSRAVTG